MGSSWKTDWREIAVHQLQNPDFQVKKPRLSYVIDLAESQAFGDRSDLIPSLLTPCGGSLFCTSAAVDGRERER